MKRLTHAELADAHGREQWTVLWEHAERLAKLAIKKSVKRGSIKPEYADDDLLQEALLIGGRAIRDWNPIECAFSTHVVNRVRWDLLRFLAKKHNGGIGSEKQRPVVLSTGEMREYTSFAAVIAADYDGDDEGDGGTFDAALTYNGVHRGVADQWDGTGIAPEGFGDPSEEADRVAAEEALHAVLRTLTLEQQEMLRSLYGIGRPLEHIDVFADRLGLTTRTVYRRRGELLEYLAKKLPQFAHLGYGSKENVRDTQ